MFKVAIHVSSSLTRKLQLDRAGCLSVEMAVDMSVGMLDCWNPVCVTDVSASRFIDAPHCFASLVVDATAVGSRVRISPDKHPLS